MAFVRVLVKEDTVDLSDKTKSRIPIDLLFRKFSGSATLGGIELIEGETFFVHNFENSVLAARFYSQLIQNRYTAQIERGEEVVSNR